MSASNNPLPDLLLWRAHQASRILAIAETEQKDRALAALARLVRRERGALIATSALDASESGLTGPLLDRLTLDERRVEQMAQAIDEVRQLPDPVERLPRAGAAPMASRSSASGRRWASCSSFTNRAPTSPATRQPSPSRAATR